MCVCMCVSFDIVAKNGNNVEETLLVLFFPFLCGLLVFIFLGKCRLLVVKKY